MALPKKVDVSIVEAAVELLGNHVPAFGVGDPTCREFSTSGPSLTSMDAVDLELSGAVYSACLSAAYFLKYAFDQQVQLCQFSPPRPPAPSD